MRSRNWKRWSVGLVAPPVSGVLAVAAQRIWAPDMSAKGLVVLLIATVVVVGALFTIAFNRGLKKWRALDHS
jgi:hypothetical protein